MYKEGGGGWHCSQGQGPGGGGGVERGGGGHGIVHKGGGGAVSGTHCVLYVLSCRAAPSVP